MLERISDRFLKYSLLVIFLFLSVISFVSTQSCDAQMRDFSYIPIYNLPDNIFLHAAAVLLFGLVWAVLQKRSAQFGKMWQKYRHLTRILLTVIMILLAWSIHHDGTREPYGDQAQVYGAAMYFNSGLFVQLSPGGYLDMYPQQLGYVLLLQLIFALTRVSSFQMIQVLNCICVGCIAYGICLLADSLTDDALQQFCCTIVIYGCLPLYLFPAFVYGDIPSLAFAVYFLYHMVRALQTGRIRHFILSAADLCLAVLLKKNALILLIAAALILLLRVIATRKKRYLALLIGLCALPFLSLTAVEKHYEQVSGYASTGGIPAIAWITMGTIEQNAPGWFNNYAAPLYNENNCDSRETSARAVEKLKERVSYFAENPVYALSFWKRKVCTQWNDPFYHSDELLYLNTGEPPRGITAFLLAHKSGIRILLSLGQNLVYLGLLFYFLFRDNRDKPERLLPELCLLGGFLFSLIWEANSRFILVYFVISLPLSFTGWQMILHRLETLSFRTKQ